MCKLQKALYGLRVSSKRWYIKFGESMQKLNFQNNFEPRSATMINFTKTSKTCVLYISIKSESIKQNKRTFNVANV